MRSNRSLLVLLGVLLGACGRRGDAESAAAPAGDSAAAGVVDSVFPMPVMLERFRAGLTEPAALRGTAASVEVLARGVLAALAAGDTTAFEPLALNQAEFAWLYYPSTATAQPPYELPPGLAWFQLQEKSRRGVLRAFRELGGHRLEYRGHQCDAEPKTEGENRIWTGCRVSLVRDGQAVTLRLFGAVIERGGRFEIVSFDNDF
ncbi:MAG: hypothetical protein AB7L66_20945 [Gemmatimonadales bacterium]